MHKWFTPTAVARLRREIAAAHDAGLIFSASLANDQLTQIEVFALGDTADTVVPPGRDKIVLICNHPSGDLTPTGAEITLAARLAREGIGYVIIDNHVRKTYILLVPAEESRGVAVSRQLVEATLGPEGSVAGIMSAYEDRPQQLAMAADLAQVLNQGGHALAEAGTGVGKSLAYLAPTLTWAAENNRRVVVSTNTINLQEQLLHKDIPLLQKALPFGFKAVLLKGRANYLCRRRFREFLQRGEELATEKDSLDLQAMIPWEKNSQDGSLSDLGFNPGSLWESICSESDSCLRLNCQFFRQCFFHNARREALSAQVIIANHSLLFADLALRSKGAESAVLPEYHCLILDEAHNIERAATDWLGGQVSRLSFSRQLARLYTIRAGKVKGLLFVLENKLMAAREIDREKVAKLLETIRQDLAPECLRLSEEVNAFFGAAGDFLRAGGGLKMRLPATDNQHPGWLPLTEKADGLCSASSRLRKLLGELQDQLEGLGPQGFEVCLPQSLEIGGIRGRLQRLEADLQEVLTGQDVALVRWVELTISARGPRAVFCYAPLHVAETLRENLWRKLPTVILTSATLTVNKSFGYIRERLGLTGDFPVAELQYESPFNFQEQVSLGIVTDLPDPAQGEFPEKIIPILKESLLASRGRGLVLFTSYSLLKEVGLAIEKDLQAQNIHVLCQGDMPRHKLLEQFREDTTSVLMATASFWEGVDVPGESLSNLILTRLPFNVPDEPIFEARLEECARQGKNPFYALQMPAAVLRFKQGFGRLIRTKRDKGVVLVLDKRITSKGYGRWFLASLPPCPLCAGPAREVLAGHKLFLL